jgi:hypothetical protein
VSLIDALRTVAAEVTMPLPGGGETALRHAHLMALARRDLPLARLAEAHWDAIAILSEVGRTPQPGTTYGVWASEIPGQALVASDGKLWGTKRFCTGASILDRALVTVGPEQRLLDLDLRANAPSLAIDDSAWTTTAFEDTRTANVTFEGARFQETDWVGGPQWYTGRPGFWAGACGPAACWAGGAAGLLDWAIGQKRDDPHTLAHLGAMSAAVWAMESWLRTAGEEIDAAPDDVLQGRVRALRLRHLVESACVEIVQRLGRAYGPHPLALERSVSRRITEVELYVRQCHAERDLEVLGRLLRG